MSSENTKEEWPDISRIFQLFFTEVESETKENAVWGFEFIIRYRPAVEWVGSPIVIFMMHPSICLHQY